MADRLVIHTFTVDEIVEEVTCIHVCVCVCVRRLCVADDKETWSALSHCFPTDEAFRDLSFLKTTSKKMSLQECCKRRDKKKESVTGQ